MFLVECKLLDIVGNSFPRFYVSRHVILKIPGLSGSSRPLGCTKILLTPWPVPSYTLRLRCESLVFFIQQI